MEERYTVAEIRRAVIESTDCDLHEQWNPYDPPGELTWEQWKTAKDDWRLAVERLYGQYGEEIWQICLQESQTRVPQGESYGEAALEKLARLDLAAQVSEPKLFEEFMVRNALRLNAIEILKSKGLEQPSKRPGAQTAARSKTQAEMEEYEALKASLNELAARIEAKEKQAENNDGE